MSDLSELFALDPLKLTDQNLETIITRMREAQAQYELGVKTVVAPKAPKAPKEKKPSASAALLKELGLE